VEVAQPFEEQPVEPTGPRAALELILSRHYGPYFFGNAASATGTWFQNLAAALLVYQLTHSAFLLGLLSFGQFAPALLLAPWTGGVADRFDRRRLLLVLNVAATVLTSILAVLTWTGHVDQWTLIAFAFGNGLTTAFTSPAASAMIATIVPRRQLASAVALNSMTYNLARALGPVLAAACVRTLGFGASFAVNAGSFVVLAVAVLFLRPRQERHALHGGSRLRDSLELLRRPRLRLFLLVVAVVGFASDPINTEAAAFAAAFHRDPKTWAGVIIGAFGAGAVTAALLLAGRVEGSRRRTTITLATLGLGIVVFAVTPWFWLAFVPAYVAGVGYLATNAGATSRLQLEVEDHLRGRVMALWGVAFLGLRPLASLADGAIAHAVGVRWAAVALAVPALAVAAALAKSLQTEPRSLIGRQ
jgi:MFS family permease